MRRLACAFVLAGAVCLLAGSPSDARAAPQRSSSGLQLSILTPDSGTIGDRFSLDVSFRGSTVDSVELYLDNALVAKRQISTAQARGVISFMLDSTQLTEGPHDVLVCAYGVDGRSTAASAKLRIPPFDLTAPVRIAYPQNGIEVSGVVPIRVSLDSEIQRQKPFVTFFVDKELKVLRNFPPYEYNWDTTKVENGWHIVEAWSQTADSIAPTKARPVHVSVNNASGETRKLDKIEDLRNEAARPTKALVLKPANPVDPSTARPGSAPVTPGIDAAAPGISARLQPGAVSGMRAKEPSSFGYGYVSGASVAAPGFAFPTARVARPAARMMGGAAVQPNAMMPVAKGPGPVLPGLGAADGIFPVIAPTRGVGDGLLKVQPGETLAGISRRAGIQASEIAKLNNLRAGQKLPAGRSLIIPHGGAFDVAFDGVQIAFDVPPRVQGGIKLAPFRQIFEHTGGRLYWFSPVKTVRAVNSSREIELKIGRHNALVNNESVTLERTPYIDSGRTIVPMTFIRDSLNVKINYDAKSGRLLIQSK